MVFPVTYTGNGCIPIILRRYPYYQAGEKPKHISIFQFLSFKNEFAFRFLPNSAVNWAVFGCFCDFFHRFAVFGHTYPYAVLLRQPKRVAMRVRFQAAKVNRLCACTLAVPMKRVLRKPPTVSTEIHRPVAPAAFV